MNTQENELKFLKQYYEFYTLKVKDIEKFRKAASVLVTAGQIQAQSLSLFMTQIENDIRIADLEKQIEMYKKEIQNIKKTQTVIISPINDPCGRGFSGRSNC